MTKKHLFLLATLALIAIAPLAAQIGGSPSVGNHGTITSAGSPRAFQVALKYVF